MLALAPATTAAAAPAGDPATISLADLGSSDTIYFDARRDTSISNFSVHVTNGLSPSAMNDTLEMPVTLKSGYVAVTQNGKTVSRQPLPLADGAKLVIPLAGAEVSDGWASVTLTITALPTDANYCWDTNAPIRLVNSSVTFTGNPAPPGTVAEFLPPSLARLTIGVPLKPSASESEAAIQLAAAMATRYGWQKTEIAVVPIPGGVETMPAPGPRERQIVVRENPDKGLTLAPRPGTPVLLITGPGPELTNQTRLLTDPALAFALSTKAVADELTSDTAPAPQSTTLAQLRQRVGTSESLRPQVEIKIDQTLFAEPVANVRVHLIGSYTPLPANFNGELLATIGDEVIDRWPVDAQGDIDRWVDIPNHLVDRTTYLKLKEQTAGDPGRCNDYLDMALRIDGKTEIQVSRAGLPVPPGFRSLPQALMPVIPIGMELGSATDTARAAKIMVGLQRASALPLTAQVASLQDVIAGRDPAILISANGWANQNLALPFSTELGRITIAGLDPSGNSTSLTLDPAVKWGALQTLFDGHRSLLVATSNGAPAQLDELLRWLDAEPGRWSDLDGRAIISVPFNAPVTVPNRRADLATEKAKAGLAASGWPWLVASGIAAAALVGAVLILYRSRKPRAAAAARADSAPREGEYDERGYPEGFDRPADDD
jgi:hypothetical protein